MVTLMLPKGSGCTLKRITYSTYLLYGDTMILDPPSVARGDGVTRRPERSTVRLGEQLLMLPMVFSMGCGHDL
jgi:hypothetical protein